MTLARSLPALTLLACAGLASAQAYRYDDGTGESTIGLSGGGAFTFANEFTVAAGVATITSIDVSLSTLELGRVVTAKLYSDPNGDGNPSDAILLSSFAQTVPIASVEGFSSFDIPDVTLAPGSRFFAAITVVHVDGEFPARVDTTTPVGRSWISQSSQLGQGTTGPISNFGFQGNFMIRANASLVPEPATLAALGLGLLGIARRKRKA